MPAFAVIAVAMLFLPRVHFVGSFTEQSYLAQVVSELFAVAMWWAIVVWDEQPGVAGIGLFALAGVAAFLTWPVWTGPLLVVLAAIVLLHGERSWMARLGDMTLAAMPMAIFAVMHGTRHAYGFRMVGTGGFAIWPTPGLLGWWYLTLVGGRRAVLRHRAPRARRGPARGAPSPLQAAALVWTAHNAGAVAPYLALKMFYLAVYPLAVAIAILLAAVWRVAVRSARVPDQVRAPAGVGARRGRLAIAVARPLVAAPRPRPVVDAAGARWRPNGRARRCRPTASTIW